MAEITVLLATRNGEKVLPRTLEGYTLQKDVPFQWKLVVVDNGSTDQTSDIIKHYQSRLKIESVFESVAGKNRALNAGLQAIDGEIIIVSDDDGIPHPDFLVAWRRVFSRQPSYEIFGGLIEPLFDVEPPEWMSRRTPKFDDVFAGRDLPEGPVEAAEIFGPNMAVRRSVFAQGLRFDESIGPNRTDPNYPMGSETEFCVRACSYGHKAWFSREPLVWHIIRPQQFELNYWSQRAYRLGRGEAQLLWSKGTPEMRFGYSTAALTISGLYQTFRRCVFWCRTLTPVPERRYNATWNYHLHRGFGDEFKRRMKNYRALQEKMGS